MSRQAAKTQVRTSLSSMRAHRGRTLAAFAAVVALAATAALRATNATAALRGTNATSAPVVDHTDSSRPPGALADPDATSAEPTDTPGWTRHDTGPFSIELPPDWEYVPRQGVDSFVGEFIGPDVRLWFDYGDWWNSRPDEGDPGYQVIHERVDHRAAQVWLPIGPGADLTALYIDQ